ncbi:MAG TPA: O-antigen ligase family protein [Ktedonobacterales bacterium]|jgi:O-antigen ligase
MFARGALVWKQEHTGASRLGLLAWALEKLALAAFVATILLLGFWRTMPLDWFSQSWTIGSQYRLVTVFNTEFQRVILYPSDLAAAATIILWGLGRVAANLARQERAPLRLGPRYLTLPLIGLAAVSALSATQAALAILSLEMALHLLLLAALVIAISNLRPPLWAVVATLALLLVIEGALSLAQAWAQSTLLSQFLLNWSHNATATSANSSVVQLPNGTRWLRAYGTFPHPNILGGFLCLAIPIVAGAYLRLGRRSISAWLLLAAVGLGMLALLLSFSRAAWLGVFISALWAGVLLWQKASANKFAAKGVPPEDPQLRTRWSARRVIERQESAEPSSWLQALSGEFIRRNLRPILLSLVGVGLLVGLVASLGPALQSRLLLDQSPLEQRSLSERDTLLAAGAVFFIQHPWLGVGAGNMPLVELTYPPTRNIGESTHNVPVVVAVETGLFGLLLWLIPPIAALWAAWRRRAALSAAGLAASAALMALLIAAQLDHYLWTEPTGSLIWWLAVALAALWSEAGSRAAHPA